MAVHRFGLISDTHGYLHRDVFALFAGVEAIFHAGDVCGEGILDELAAVAPVFAVQGNCDVPSPRLPAHQILETPFGIAVIAHSHLIGGGMGHPKMLVEPFKHRRPRLLVFGHTHKQYCALHGETWIVNPGPAGKPRLSDRPGVVVATWNNDSDDFAFTDHDLDWRKRP